MCVCVATENKKDTHSTKTKSTSISSMIDPDGNPQCVTKVKTFFKIYCFMYKGKLVPRKPKTVPIQQNKSQYSPQQFQYWQRQS